MNTPSPLSPTPDSPPERSVAEDGELSGLRRRGYIALVLAVNIILAMALTATGQSADGAILGWVLSIIAVVVLVRIARSRLYNANVGKNWAYLALIPILGAVLLCVWACPQTGYGKVRKLDGRGKLLAVATALVVISPGILLVLGGTSAAPYIYTLF